MDHARPMLRVAPIGALFEDRGAGGAQDQAARSGGLGSGEGQERQQVTPRPVDILHDP